MNYNLKSDIHNRFDIEVIDAKTGEIKQRAQAQNVICNQLWTRLLTPNTYFNYIHYGTGTGTPAATDTSLFAFLGGAQLATSGNMFTMSRSQGVASLRRMAVLSETTANGSTLTEVGIAYNSSGATLCTHAMIKDMNGNPISITKTSTDIINVYATIYVHWNAGGYGASMCIFDYLSTDNGGASPCGSGFLGYLFGGYSKYNDNERNARAAVYAWSKKGCTNDGYLNARKVTSQYDAASKTIAMTLTRLTVDKDNLGGTMGFLMSGSSDLSTPDFYIRAGAPGIPASQILGESIGTGDGTTMQFATDFPYPTGAVIKIDGVTCASGVTISAKINTTDVISYFDGLDLESTPSNHILFPWSPPGKHYLGTRLFYNPNYEVGIGSFSQHANVTIYVSDDLATWHELSSGSVPTACQHSKYWKMVGTKSTASAIYSVLPPSDFAGNNIVFDTPPASGAVITADYTTKTIAKDANHVFDLTVTIQLGEYTE